MDTQLYTLQRGGQTLRLRPKVFRMCLYLLEHRDRVVSREELCAQVWPGRLISQATLEGLIRTVRQVVGDSGQAQSIIETLHGYGYRFVASVEERPAEGVGGLVPLTTPLLGPSESSACGRAAGLPAAVVPARQSEGALEPRVEYEAGRKAPGPNGYGEDSCAAVMLGERRAVHQRYPGVWRVARVGLVLAVAVVVVLGGGMLWRVSEYATVLEEKSRIAVLPFLDLSAEADQTYFADGMTEELIAQLARIHGLTVIARTSVMRYKGTLKDIATIGRELRVGSILEGSVRRTDNQVRVSAQLIDVASQGHLWSHKYDRELSWGFGTQSDIASRMAQQLSVQLASESVDDRLGGAPWFIAQMQKIGLGK